MGNTPEPTDADGTSLVGAATAEAPTSPVAPTEPTVLDRVRSALAGSTPRRVVGWLLVIGWVVWLVALWVTQPRLVPQDVLADELARGHVTAYRVVTVDEDPANGPFSGPYRISVYPASDAQDGVVDGAADGQQVTVAYWVDAPVAGLRVLDPNGLSSDTPAAVVASMQAAGVPEADASVFFGGLPSERTDPGRCVAADGQHPGRHRRATSEARYPVVLVLAGRRTALAAGCRSSRSPSCSGRGTSSRARCTHPVSPVGGAGWPG